ncbi:MAG: N-formylglutamate amidohydrolase [Pseudorhodoplanes sp.]
MEHIPGVLTFIPPRGAARPFVLEAPRSGREYPNDFRVAASFNDVHSSVSQYVEELYRDAPDAGASLLWALFPNSYIDANRHLDDIDPDLLNEPWPTPLSPSEKSVQLGTGLIHKVAKPGVALYDRKLSVEEVKHRIDRYYRPYHGKVAAIIDDNVKAFDRSWHWSCHRMAPVGQPHARDAGRPRKDFCISDGGGKTSDKVFLDATVSAFQSEGFTTSVNDPYLGAAAIRLHGKPDANRHSLQIEMNKALYMDEQTLGKGPRFEEIRARLAKVVQRIARSCEETL